MDLDCPVLNAVLPSNQKQIEAAIRMVGQKGKRRLGVLGLSFKAGTDDVRESPVVVMVETLVGRGYQVKVYDEAIELSRLVGANKGFLEQELPHIASILFSSIEQLVSDVDVVVLANGAEAFRSAGQMMCPGQYLIDLVGTAKDSSLTAYEGMC